MSGKTIDILTKSRTGTSPIKNSLAEDEQFPDSVKEQYFIIDKGSLIFDEEYKDFYKEIMKTIVNKGIRISKIITVGENIYIECVSYYNDKFIVGAFDESEEDVEDSDVDIESLTFDSDFNNKENVLIEKYEKDSITYNGDTIPIIPLEKLNNEKLLDLARSNVRRNLKDHEKSKLSFAVTNIESSLLNTKSQLYDKIQKEKTTSINIISTSYDKIETFNKDQLSKLTKLKNRKYIYDELIENLRGKDRKELIRDNYSIVHQDVVLWVQTMLFIDNKNLENKWILPREFTEMNEDNIFKLLKGDKNVLNGLLELFSIKNDLPSNIEDLNSVIGEFPSDTKDLEIWNKVLSVIILTKLIEKYTHDIEEKLNSENFYDFDLKWKVHVGCEDQFSPND